MLFTFLFISSVARLRVCCMCRVSLPSLSTVNGCEFAVQVRIGAHVLMVSWHTRSIPSLASTDPRCALTALSRFPLHQSFSIPLYRNASRLFFSLYWVVCLCTAWYTNKTVLRFRVSGSCCISLDTKRKQSKWCMLLHTDVLKKIEGNEPVLGINFQPKILATLHLHIVNYYATWFSFSAAPICPHLEFSSFPGAPAHRVTVKVSDQRNCWGC